MSKSKTSRDKMRFFLGEVVAQALDWPHVEWVSAKLEDAYGFEELPCDGAVRFYLEGNKKFGYVFSGTELEQTLIPSGLIRQCREKLEREYSTEAQP